MTPVNLTQPKPLSPCDFVLTFDINTDTSMLNWQPVQTYCSEDPRPAALETTGGPMTSHTQKKRKPI